MEIAIVLLEVVRVHFDTMLYVSWVSSSLMVADKWVHSRDVMQVHVSCVER